MHELSIIQSILDIVLDYANKNKAKRVIKINLKVGELSDIIPEWMQQYFNIVSKDTIAAGATLYIESIPATFRCNSCCNEYRMNKKNWKFHCKRCASADIIFSSGREYTLNSVEIE